jgi:opacity protein-like surface antigen
MEKLIATAALLLLGPALASAQVASPRDWRQGYVFFSPLATHFGKQGAGFGGEKSLYGGLGIGVDFAYESPSWSLDFAQHIPAGLGSADLSYIFFPRSSRVEPFAEGGYTLDFGDRAANGYNLGWGVNLWLRKNMAFRPEVRYYGKGYFGPSGILTFRLGFTFR